MCSKGGGSPPVPNSASTSFQSTTTPAPFATPLYQDFLNRANTLSNTPFNPAMLGQVAPLNAQQTQAGGQLFEQGMHLGEFDPAKVQSMESPFIQDVVGKTQDWFNNQNAIQGNDLMSQAIKSGNAFGGDRAGVAEGVLAGQQQLAQAPVIAGLYQSGYTQALNEYNMLKQMGMQGTQAALGWGGMEQAQTQREFDVAQQNAMMQSAYPFQTLNWYGAALGGVGPLLGAQTVGFNTPPEQSGLATGLGAASAAIGLGNAAFGGATPAGGASPTGQKRGGVVRRVRGGLVPVYIRHNGGIIPGLAYGGSSDDDDDDRQHEPSGLPEQARDERSQSEDYKPPQIGLPPREKAPAWGSQIGQLKSGSKQTTPSTFPGMGSTSTSAQPSTASQISQGLDIGTKVLSLGSKLAPLMLLNRGGGVRHLQNGGGDDVNVMSDADPDPVSPGQRLAADYSGRATWFNPRNERGGYTYRDDSGQDWTDTGAQRLREGPHASGLPSTTRGFATPGSADLGNWFEVNIPGRGRTYAQKTDIGPAGVVDLNAPLASSVGFTPGNVGGRINVRDLGSTRPPQAEDDAEHEPGGKPQQAGDVPLGGGDMAGPGGAGARPTPDAGTGAVGRKIPGLAKPAPTFAQRLAQDPFWQFGTALMAKPGLKRYPLQGVGAAAQTMSAQQTHERNRILDDKPQMFDDGKQLHALMPDGSLVPTNLPSPTGVKQKNALELQAAKHKDEEKFKTFNTPYGNVTGARQPDGKYVDTETGDVLYDPLNPTRGGAGAGAGAAQPQQPPAQQPPAQQRVIQPPRQTELTQRPEETQWPDKTPVTSQPPPQGTVEPAQKPPAQQQQPPAQTAQTAQAGPGPDLTAGGQLPLETDEQRQTAADAAARGGFKTPLPVGQGQGQVDPRLLRTMGITPDQFDGLAVRLANGDDSVLKGLGGKAWAGVARTQLRARANQWLEERYPGLGPQMANAAAIEFAGKKAGMRTFETQKARLLQAQTAVEGNIPIMMAASAKVPRTDYPTLNALILSGKKQIGDVDVVALETARRTLVTNYAAAIGRGSNALTDFSQKKAESLLEYGYSHNQMETVLRTMQREIDNEAKYLNAGTDRYLGRPAPQGQGQGQPQPQQARPVPSEQDRALGRDPRYRDRFIKQFGIEP